MKLLAAAICLLCCGCAFGQTTMDCPKGQTPALDMSVGEGGKWSIGESHCIPDPNAGKQQLICDWAKDHWHCPTKQPVETDVVDLYGRTGNVVISPDPDPDAPPFDVPAKQWDERKWKPYIANEATGYLEGCNSLIGVKCSVVGNQILRVTKMYGCADKSRFLLTSEDGKHHCLRLVP